MESFLVSIGVVTAAEIGDKTQLLAFLLATRFKKPLPIIAGILCATLLNHGLAGLVGTWITQLISPQMLRWILSISFLAMSVWMIIPDTLENEDTKISEKLGVFGATLLMFFLAEMGDKTQLATVALAAHYANIYTVISGTTIGMLIADAPAVFIGDKMAEKIPMKWVRFTAAGIFFILALITWLAPHN